MYLIKVLVSHETLLLNREYEYLSECEVAVFSRVKVPFNNQKLFGVVTKVERYDASIKRD